MDGGRGWVGGLGHVIMSILLSFLFCLVEADSFLFYRRKKLLIVISFGLGPLAELVSILIFDHKVAGSNLGDAGFFPNISDGSPFFWERFTEV